MDHDSPLQNRGICPSCKKVVPLHHVERDGKIFLAHDCPGCGPSESLASTDARRYNEKREMVGYLGEAQKTCSLECRDCRIHKPPTLVFIDVTNRCNMNCPICLANIPAMGFRFDPPMEYFERIFSALAQFNPKPNIQLFGGEPTVREDLIEIITLAKQKYGLSARVVTNGIRLADEAYCKQLIRTGAQLMFSFDGRDPAIYARTRKHPRAYEKKLQALANVGKFRKSKVTIMCCAGEGVNDHALADLVDFCHEGRHYIAALDVIPLTANWGPEMVDAHSATTEDVEKMMEAAVPGMEFFPAGMLYQLDTLRGTFKTGRMTFGGAHPNCESVSALVSDGEKYHPLSRYMKRPLGDAVREIVALDRRMGKDLPGHWLARLLGRKGRQLVYGLALLGFARRNINAREICGGNPLPALLRIAWGALRGEKMKKLLRAHTRCHDILRVIVLPFEETSCVESARLVDCPAAFAYEHPETREIRLMPVCAWAMHKDGILRSTAERYGVDVRTGEAGLTGFKKRTELDEGELE